MSKDSYYIDRLAADRLRRCYELAPPRVRQYLKAELDYVIENVQPGEIVLDLGCGYGRTLSEIAARSGYVVGIDNSLESLLAARSLTSTVPNCSLVCTDAVQMGFCDNVFDLVVCIQNGISAFHVGQRELIEESIRVTRPGGRLLFSTYSEKFWEDRLDWFRLQSEAGLLGEIDWDRTGGAEIVCKDGFRATTVPPAGFQALAQGLAVTAEITEVDKSSLFCCLTVLS